MKYAELSKGIKHNLNSEICATCTQYNNDTGECEWLRQRTHWNFICDGYWRKRSGQYRRMRAKQNKG